VYYAGYRALPHALHAVDERSRALQRTLQFSKIRGQLI
jgi:hypothetical protein